MFFQRYYLQCLSHASYLVADEQTKEAAVIDPQRDIDQYIEDAKANGFNIKYVILTHFHADFVAGHIELRDRCGATICLAPNAPAEFEFQKVGDGDEIRLGSLRMVGMTTPGHTPEGLSILLYDGKSEAPHCLFTGDTLFLGDVGRPDLLASVGFTADELADMLYDSLHDKILKLPDETLIYPAHGAGSLCGKQLSDAETSTLAEQKKVNYALAPMRKEEFKEMVTADQPDAPAYFVHDAIMNRKDRQTLDKTLEQAVTALSLEQTLEHLKSGAQMVDTRPAQEFEAAYMKGSLNVCIDGKYATWAGSVLCKETPIVVIADEDRVEESIMRLGRIGFDHVVGYLEHGMEALKDRDDLITSISRVPCATVAENLGKNVTLLDVRSEKEYSNGHVEGSLNIPLSRLAGRMEELNKDKQLYVMCHSGYRSAIACSMLVREGFENSCDVIGGWVAWKALHQPVAAV